MSHNTMIFFAGWVSGVQATGTARIATSIARVATSIARVARERERDPTNRMLNLFRCGQQKAGRSSGFLILRENGVVIC